MVIKRIKNNIRYIAITSVLTFVIAFIVMVLGLICYWNSAVELEHTRGMVSIYQLYNTSTMFSSNSLETTEGPLQPVYKDMITNPIFCQDVFREIYVYNDEGKFVASTSDKELPFEFDEAVKNQTLRKGNDLYLSYKANYFYIIGSLPIDKTIAGSDEYFWISLFLFVCILVVDLVNLLIIALIPREKISLLISKFLLFGFVFALSLASGVSLSLMYKSNIEKEKSYFLTQERVIVEGSKEFLTEKDASIEVGEIEQMYFDEICKSIDVFKSLHIKNNKLYIYKDIDSQFVFELDSEYIRNKIIDFALQSLLLCILTGIVLFESSRFMKKPHKGKLENNVKNYVSKEHRLMRISVILCGFATSISRSVQTIYMKDLASQIGINDPKNAVAIAFAITTIIATIATFFSGFLMKKLGRFSRYYKLMVLLGLIAYVIEFSMDNFYLFCIGACFFETTISLSSMSISFYSIMQKNEEEKDKAFTMAKGGNQCGMCAGIIVGGVLCTQFTPRFLYFAGIVSFLTLAIFTFITRIDGKVSVHSKNTAIFNVFKNKKAILFLICIVLPSGMEDIFMAYNMPLDIQEWGYTVTVISALMLVKRLINAYAGKFYYVITKYFSVQNSAIIYQSLAAIMFIVYGIFPNIISMILISFALGFLDSFGNQLVQKGVIETGKDRTDYSSSDSSIMNNLTRTLGGSVGPVLVSFTKTVFCLPVAMLGGATVLLGTAFCKKRNKK